MKNFTILNRTKIKSSLKQALICFSFSLVSGSTLLCQENPWTTIPQGENPWVTTETEETVVSDTAKQIIITVNGAVISNEANTKASAASKSTSSKRYFNFNGTEVMLNAKSFNYSKSLRRHGKSLHEANGALFGGIVTGSIANFYAVPVNLIASVVPTNQINREIKKFKKDNPHATAEEVRQVKKGINQKRITKAMIGNGIGMLINFGVIIAILL